MLGYMQTMFPYCHSSGMKDELFQGAQGSGTIMKIIA